jgi:hypothetical protein
MNTPEYELLARRSHPARRTEAANFPVIAEATASPEVAARYVHFRARFGRPTVPDILQCFATHPPLLEHRMAVSESLLFSDGALSLLSEFANPAQRKS